MGRRDNALSEPLSLDVFRCNSIKHNAPNLRAKMRRSFHDLIVDC